MVSGDLMRQRGRSPVATSIHAFMSGSGGQQVASRISSEEDSPLKGAAAYSSASLAGSLVAFPAIGASSHGRPHSLASRKATARGASPVDSPSAAARRARGMARTDSGELDGMASTMDYFHVCSPASLKS